jgi:hypothetical protein
MCIFYFELSFLLCVRISKVVWLRRGKGETCLKKWEEVLLSGKFDTDQESLDHAEKLGACPHSFSLPTRHLLFAKDYIAMVFTSGQTFVHLTAAGRPEDTDYFYREIMVPRIRNSLHPPLNPAKLLRRKVCAVQTIGGHASGLSDSLAAAATSATSAAAASSASPASSAVVGASSSTSAPGVTTTAATATTASATTVPVPAVAAAAT